jgi:hypothetical protein
MKERKIIKLLIPLIAVVVVVESVVLVSNLDKKTVDVSDTSLEETVVPTEEVKEPVADFIFETETKEMKVGKSYKVNLNLVGSKDVNLDAMETYIKYDPAKVTVSKLVANKDLPEMTKTSGIDTKTGLISSVFIWENIGEYYSVKTDKVSPVLSFMVTPKIVGETEISLLGSNATDGYSTLLVENVTSNQLLFLSNKLEINTVN